jgi:hypothetical protein
MLSDQAQLPLLHRGCTTQNLGRLSNASARMEHLCMPKTLDTVQPCSALAAAPTPVLYEGSRGVISVLHQSSRPPTTRQASGIMARGSSRGQKSPSHTSDKHLLSTCTTETSTSSLLCSNIVDIYFHWRGILRFQRGLAVQAKPGQSEVAKLLQGACCALQIHVPADPVRYVASDSWCA